MYNKTLKDWYESQVVSCKLSEDTATLQGDLQRASYFKQEGINYQKAVEEVESKIK